MLDELLSIDPQSLDDDELRAHVLALGQVSDRIEAARLATLGEWDVRAVWAYDGAAGGAGWLAAQGNVARGAASSSLRTARHLRTMPATREAVRAGRLAPAKAKLLAGVINPRTETAFARDEKVLVSEARHLTVDETAMLLRRWQLLADENGPRPADDHDRDTAHGSQILNGRFRMDANLDTECGAIVRGVWDSIIDEMRHAARDGHGSLPSAPQLRADALVEMARRASRAERGPGARPLIWVVAPRDTIPGATMPVPTVPGVTVPGATVPGVTVMGATTPDGTVPDGTEPMATILGGSAPGPAADPAAVPWRQMPGSAPPGSALYRCGPGICEIPGAGPIPARDAVRIACDASISKVLTDELGRIVDVGRAERTATPVQRRLLWARDRGCTFPGCGRPPDWCEAHHLRFWEHGGPTDLSNLALLCSFHHHLCHKGFSAERVDGRVVFTRPDGTPVIAPRVAA